MSYALSCPAFSKNTPLDLTSGRTQILRKSVAYCQVAGNIARYFTGSLIDYKAVFAEPELFRIGLEHGSDHGSSYLAICLLRLFIQRRIVLRMP